MKTGYLKRVQAGEELLITSRGKIIARLVAETDRRQQAKQVLLELRKHSRVGDVVSPIDIDWKANH